MELYDTLSRKTHTLRPLNGKYFAFYCCGPTVYGPAHIGNFRTFVLQDIFRRTLESEGIATRHVRNITDVDDKTIRESQKKGVTLEAFTTHWTTLFHQDCEALHCLPPHIEPRATAHIDAQITMIASLIDKGHAYCSEDGSVYFAVDTFEDYGKLSHLDTRELSLGKTQNTRADADEYDKESVADFVLWKARKPEDGDNFWQSPWGEGRPGWHLECSAMIKTYLDKDFDLHAGGEDLIFPHHENEIAQSRCSCQGGFAAHWFHTTHLLVDGKKMSKSLGNLYTLDDLKERGVHPTCVRYVLLSAHYRKQLNFTLHSLESAKTALLKIAHLLKKLNTLAPCPPQKKTRSIPEDWGIFSKGIQALRADLNTPQALGELFVAIKSIGNPNELEAGQHRDNLLSFLEILGLPMNAFEEEVCPSFEEEIPSSIMALAQERSHAKQARDWSKADTLRDAITSAGWKVTDTPEGFSLEKL